MTAVLPGPGIELSVEIGVGRLTPTAQWDYEAWDQSSWGDPESTLGDFVDVTCYTVDGVSLGAGSSADGVVTRWEAASCAFQLIGDLFDPNAGPWVGLLGPGVPVRVRWRPASGGSWWTAFTGQTTDDGFSYDTKTQLANINATDGTAILSAFDAPEQPAVGQGDSAAARVARILDFSEWPADRRDITAGGVALKSTTLADSAWTMLLAVADTDLAFLYHDRSGNLAYRPEGKIRPAVHVEAVIGCDIPDELLGGYVPIEPVNIEGQTPTTIRNIVAVSRQTNEGDPDASTVTVRDEPSVSRFLAHTYSRTDLQHLDDSWSTLVATTILASSAWPSDAPASVTLSSRADPASTALLLALEPSQGIVVYKDGRAWRCCPAGWSVNINRREVSGEITLLDETRWIAGLWDQAAWDIDHWGL
jgi:hypothetical protein